MNRWILMGCTMILCIAIILFLPKLFSLQTSYAQLKNNVSVFNPHAMITLGDDNLVDTLSSLPLTLPISKVEWKEATLSLDLKVVNSDTSITDIYEGIAEVIDFSFEGTANVKRLMLRLVAEDRWVNTHHLLLAVDVNRDQWSKLWSNELRNNGVAPLPEALKQTFHITETKLWLNQFDK